MSTVFRLLSLIYTNDYSSLPTFLADVRNVRRLRTRALRLRRWGLLNLIERRVVDVTIITLTRVRSRMLLETLIKIFEKLLPNLLTRFERKFLENMKAIKEALFKLGQETRNLYILRLIKNEDYLFSTALNMTSSEISAAGVIYSLE